MKKEPWFVIFIIASTMLIVSLSGFLESYASKLELIGVIGLVLYGAYCIVAYVKGWLLFAGVVPLDPTPENKVWRLAAVVIGVLFYAIGVKFLYDI